MPYKDLKTRHLYALRYYRIWRKKNRAKLNAKGRELYHKNPEKHKKRHYIWAKNNYLYLRKYMKKFRKSHRIYISLSNQRQKHKIRTLVFNHYGNSCTCCKESNAKFLTLDHITKPQKKDERKNLWYFVYKNKFPKRFRIMCYNCNLGRDKNGGICPHKETK